MTAPFKKFDIDVDRQRFPIDPWQLIEREQADDPGLTGTLFAVGNGYIGMRADHTPDPAASGTFVNGLHETFEIEHAENAYGLARTGQTMLEAPDGKTLEMRVGDEVLRLDPFADDRSAIEGFTRAVDFRTGVLTTSFRWHLRAGGTVDVTTERFVSFRRRHLAALRIVLTIVDLDATLTIGSHLINRQDIAATPSGPTSNDPRRGRRFDRRVLEPAHRRHDEAAGTGGTVVLGYRTINSDMTVAAGYRHAITSDQGAEPTSSETTLIDDIATTAFTIEPTRGERVEFVKYLAYHTAGQVPDGNDGADIEQLADRVVTTLAEGAASGWPALVAEHRDWLDTFWDRADITIDGDPPAQQAIRWNLFQLAQASAQVGERGIAAKAVTANGYEGHYFWDTEMYVVPLLAYTHPDAARDLLRFRYRLLPAARRRAEVMDQRGALYPWRTINGEEASAYYPAGTAQYHINADIAHAIDRYVAATDDVDFLRTHGAEMLVELARLYADLGFYGADEAFHLHAVTGPDEYTAVVDDNLYTNVMARFTMRFAADTVDLLEREYPADHAGLIARCDVDADEVAEWRRAADAMYVGYDERLQINPQDNSFLFHEPWDWETTPPEKYPLLLHFHPLVIYRHKVLKQADVVLAMVIRGHEFDAELQRRNFDYYDPITTGDSSLSACVQAIAAFQVGRLDVAWRYLEQSLYLDLANTHGNTEDGAHIANVGGVWAALVHGVAGMRDDGRALRLRPRLPEHWTSMTFDVLRHGSVVMIEVDDDGATVTVRSGKPVPVIVGEDTIEVAAGSSVRIAEALL